MKYTILREEAGITIKDFLKRNNFSASLTKQLKKYPFGITVNGLHQNVTYRLRENDTLELSIEDREEHTNHYLVPVDIPVDIIFENDNMTVVNKPFNMPTHESINNRGNTLANALAFRYRDKPYVFRATNRLDKDTSGVVVTANNKLYSAILSDKIKRRLIRKEYIAVVCGSLQGKGVVEAPIKRLGESIIKRGVSDDGEYALTEYQVLASSDDISLVMLSPKTGRTHQLRVHMAYIGHPLVGDALYGGRTDILSRQALHCHTMDIDEIGKFTAPLPEDMNNLIRRFFGNEKVLP